MACTTEPTNIVIKDIANQLNPEYEVSYGSLPGGLEDLADIVDIEDFEASICEVVQCIEDQPNCDQSKSAEEAAEELIFNEIPLVESDGPLENRVSTYSLRNCVENAKKRIPSFLMILAQSKLDGTKAAKNEMIQRRKEGESFLKKIDNKNKFPRKYVPVKSYEQMKQAIAFFFLNEAKGNFMPFVMFIGHGAKPSGDLVFTNACAPLHQAFEDIRQMFLRNKSDDVPSSALRIVFTECWSYQLDGGKGDGIIHQKLGVEYIYFTNAAKPTTTSTVSTEDDDYKTLSSVANFDEVHLDMGSWHPYVQQCVDTIAPDLRKVYSLSKEKAKEASVSLILSNKYPSVPIQPKYIKRLNELLETVQDLRSKLKSCFIIGCKPQKQSRKYDSAVHQVISLCSGESPLKIVEVQTSSELMSSFTSFIKNEGYGKHLPILVIVSAGTTDSKGCINNVIFSGGETALIDSLYKSAQGCFSQFKERKVLANALRILFLGYTSGDEPDGANPQNGQFLLATNAHCPKVVDAFNIEVNDNAEAIIGKGPLNSTLG